MRTLADLDRLRAGLSGSFHLVAAIHGGVRVQGSVSGLRRVFYTERGQLTVAADRADVLAGLGGLAVDEQWLAARLVYPYIPRKGQPPVWIACATEYALPATVQVVIRPPSVPFANPAYGVVMNCGSPLPAA